MSNKATIHSDGGARGNPGPAGIGVVVDYAGKRYQIKEYIGETTNNQAEYRAVIAGLEKAKVLGAQEVIVFLDSELVAEQLNRKYKVKNADLAGLFVRAWNLTLSFKKIAFKHIRRSDNTEADRLVNQAIDEATK